MGAGGDADSVEEQGRTGHVGGRQLEGIESMTRRGCCVSSLVFVWKAASFCVAVFSSQLASVRHIGHNYSCGYDLSVHRRDMGVELDLSRRDDLGVARRLLLQVEDHQPFRSWLFQPSDVDGLQA